jgi:DNA-binding NarL/FixJ family response regulator
LWRASIALAAQGAATVGHAAHASTLAGLLRPFAGINIGAVDHYLGVALVVAGNVDEAIEHLDAAVALHTTWGASAFRVASQAELANALHKRGKAEDRARIAGLEASVRVEAARLGIVRPLIARDRQSATRVGRRSLPDGLTEREAEILKRVADGCANKEIANELRISVHTVERHIANLYAKIGVRNRAEAAAYAVLHEVEK